MNDEPALLAAIRANPEDDTVRLVYADWLDENAPLVMCKACDGYGGYKGYSIEHQRRINRPECPRCRSVGYIPHEMSDRAEFIRVQCSLAGGREGTANEDSERRRPLLVRESALLEANRERWQKAPCPACAGATVICKGGSLYVKCGGCSGTGDALHGREVAFRRGSPHELGGCRLYDVFRPLEVPCPVCKGKSDWAKHDVPDGTPGCGACGNHGVVDGELAPTPWALAVFRAHPTLARVPLSDVIQTREYGGGYDTAAVYRSAVPPAVWDALCPGSQPADAFVERRDRGEIGDALATAVGDVLRAHALGAG